MTFEKGHKDLVPKESRIRAGKKILGNTWGFRKGHPTWNKGKKTSEEVRKKQSEARKKFYEGGGVHWNYLDGRSKEKDNIKFIKGRRESHINYCKASGMRYIPEKLVVHHLDLNPSNNNPENLILMQHGHHSSVHAKIHNLIRGGNRT